MATPTYTKDNSYSAEGLMRVIEHYAKLTGYDEGYVQALYMAFYPYFESTNMAEDAFDYAVHSAAQKKASLAFTIGIIIGDINDFKRRGNWK